MCLWVHRHELPYVCTLAAVTQDFRKHASRAITQHKNTEMTRVHYLKVGQVMDRALGSRRKRLKQLQAGVTRTQFYLKPLILTFGEFKFLLF